MSAESGRPNGTSDPSRSGDGSTWSFRVDPDQPGVLVRAEESGSVGSLEEAAAIGTRLASQLRAGGAR